jgi:hypothetical protein
VGGDRAGGPLGSLCQPTLGLEAAFAARTWIAGVERPQLRDGFPAEPQLITTNEGDAGEVDIGLGGHHPAEPAEPIGVGDREDAVAAATLAGAAR